MSIGDLKSALAEVKRMCEERDYCYGCPFEIYLPDRHICRLSPKLYSDMLPCGWDVDGWEEDSNETD